MLNGSCNKECTSQRKNVVFQQHYQQSHIDHKRKKISCFLRSYHIDDANAHMTRNLTFRKSYLIHIAKTLPFGFSMLYEGGQKTEPKKTCHFQISMKIETQVMLGLPSQVCETHG